MILHWRTITLTCDGSPCLSGRPMRATFTATSVKSCNTLARQAGWRVRRDGSVLCPCCVSGQVPHGVSGAAQKVSA